VILMAAIDKIYTAHPFFGARRIIDELQERGLRTSRRRIRRLMEMMGLETLSPRPNTSRPGKDHVHYPYEEVYLKSYVDMVEARRELNEYLNWYNEKRKHSSLGNLTPDDVYFNREKETDEAA